MDEKNVIPALNVLMEDIRELLSQGKECELLFRLRSENEACRFYVCRGFTLTLNRLFLLDLEEVDYRYMRREPAAFMNAASCDDIIRTMEEMGLSNSWCCFCRFTNGKFAIIKSAIALIDKRISLIDISPLASFRHA
jgi:hypothetical protein